MRSAGPSSLRAQLLEEVIEEMKELRGETLAEFLSSIGLDDSQLLAEFEQSLELFKRSSGRRRFDMARILVSPGQPKSTIVNLDAARKRSVFADIQTRVTQTGEMTIAARNRKIETDEDLDSFLDACVHLGIIDEDGKLKE